MSKIAIVGFGYIGGYVCSSLLDAGYSVTIFDRFIFGNRVKVPEAAEVRFIDIRDISAEQLISFDCVIDLCGVSNDPSGKLNRDLTVQINQVGRVRLANEAKKAQVPRYIFASSCSVFGASESICSEESATNPLTLYAKSCLHAETEIKKIASSGFRINVLRFGTVYGFSEFRMRMDLVVQLMVRSALEHGRLTVLGGGRQKRPLVSLQTISSFIDHLLRGDSWECFDLTCVVEQNYTILELAHKIAEHPRLNAKVDIVPDDHDERDYAVDNRKFKVMNPALDPERVFNEEISNLIQYLSRNGSYDVDESVTLKTYKRFLGIQENILNAGHLLRF